MDKKLVKVGQRGNISAYMVGNGVMSATNSDENVMSSYVDTPSLFDDTDDGLMDLADKKSVTINGNDYSYVSWGDDNNLPFKLRRLISKNMVTARSLAFNIQAFYGHGV